MKKAVLLALILLSNTVFAEKLLSQNWVADLNGQTNEAYTANDPSSSFGLYCAADKCLFYLHQSFQCEPGTKYSVLMNSASLSTALGMECTAIQGNLFQILDPFEAVFKAIQSGEMIGFAVALQSGAFAVTRFSLLGAKPALERVLFEAEKSRHLPQNSAPMTMPKPALKDQSI